MEKFQTFTGIVAPLDHSNVDTDAIIPKQFLKSIQRTGFGPNLFDEWRYLDYGEPGQDCSTRQKNPDFILNQEPYSSAGILLTRKNFGCGSSREHAPWALLDFGIKVILAESFADIFYNNCFKNGILPIVLKEKTITALFASAEEKPVKLTINLREQIVEDEKGNQIAFNVDPYRKHCLLEGLDEIGLTLKNQEVIQRFEENHRSQFPWLF